MTTAALTPSADTYLAQAGGTHGSGTTMVAGRLVVLESTLLARMLMRFSLADYASTNIYAATLSLSVDSTFVPEGAHVITLHEMTTTDWTEAAASWTAASGVLNWTTAGGDFNATAFATGSVSTGATTVDIDVLEKVLASRGGNLDFILRMPETTGYDNHYLTADTKEHATEALRPQLILALSAVSADWTATDEPLHWRSGREPIQWAATDEPLQWPSKSEPPHWASTDEPLHWVGA